MIVASFQKSIKINSLTLYRIENKNDKEILNKKIINVKNLSLPDIKYILLYDKNIKGYIIN